MKSTAEHYRAVQSMLVEILPIHMAFALVDPRTCAVTQGGLTVVTVMSG